MRMPPGHLGANFHGFVHLWCVTVITLQHIWKSIKLRGCGYSSLKNAKGVLPEV
jgi:hypothetical protein